MGNETRERLALRMQPETRRRIEQWYAADNCQSMNEFVEKAVNFMWIIWRYRTTKRFCLWRSSLPLTAD